MQGDNLISNTLPPGFHNVEFQLSSVEVPPWKYMALEYVLERDIEFNTLLHLISLFEPFRDKERSTFFF